MGFQTEGSNRVLSRFIVSSLHGLDCFDCSSPIKYSYSCSSDMPSLCKPIKMRLFTGGFSTLLFLTLGVCPHTQQVSFDGRAADRNAMPHSSHQRSMNFLRVCVRLFINDSASSVQKWQCYQTLPPRPMTLYIKMEVGGETSHQYLPMMQG